MDAFIHVANVLFLASYSVRDILWLRGLTIVATVTLMPYYGANGLWLPIYWSSGFVAINLYQVYRLLLERRPVRLTLDQQRLYRLGFDRLPPRDFLRLLEQGGWETHGESRTLVEQGAKLDRLTVVAEGSAEVVVDGETVSTLQPGQFVGEMSFVTGQPACARVVIASGSRVVHWPHEGLRKFLEERADVRASLQNVIGTDLATKLRRDAGGSDDARPTPDMVPAPA